MLRNIALTISYDGTDYAGWQIQNNQPSVQGMLEKALTDLHGKPTAIIGAGRTDAGVHAIGQVGNFMTEKDSIPGWKFCDALNARLPPDIRILNSRQVAESFHARRNAVSRSYEYRLVETHSAPAHLVRFVWRVSRLPSLGVLNDMARTICGTHDFTAFVTARDASPHRIREIRHAVFLSTGPITVFQISGDSFLWRMVRSLLGTMMDVALRGGDSQAIRDILYLRDRKAAGPTAPAKGLFLKKVEYGPQWRIY